MTAQDWLAWESAPKKPELSHTEVHVWAASLDLAGPELSPLYAVLSPDEHARAFRYRFAQDGARFVAARGLLRIILGRYLCVEPDQIALRYSAHGKPQLDVQRQDNPSAIRAEALQFSLSHCENLALYAVALGRRVGVDLERIRPGFADATLAEHFFSPAEVAALHALSLADQQPAFLACWTRKEAYLKARGEGLTIPMDSFTVSLAPGQPASLLEVRADPQEPKRWSLCDLALGSGHAAALAVEGHGWELRCWQW